MQNNKKVKLWNWAQLCVFSCLSVHVFKTELETKFMHVCRCCVLLWSRLNWQELWRHTWMNKTETIWFCRKFAALFFFSPLSANILVQPRLQPTHEAVHLRDLAAPIPDEGQLAHHQLWLNPFPGLYNYSRKCDSCQPKVLENDENKDSLLQAGHWCHRRLRADGKSLGGRVGGERRESVDWHLGKLSSALDN